MNEILYDLVIQGYSIHVGSCSSKSPEICFAANTCDGMNRIATAAIEITITVIVKPFCAIHIKLIIMNLLIKKALFM